MIVLASTSYDIAYQALPGFGVLDGASVAPLAATMLGVSVWWSSTWLPSP